MFIRYFTVFLIVCMCILIKSDILAQEKYDIPGKLFASTFTEAKGGRLEENTDSSDHPYFLGGIRQGNYFVYKLNVIKDGMYVIDYRITSSRSTKLNLEIVDNNGKVQSLEDIEFPKTGGWRHWRTFQGKILNLKKGIYSLKIKVIKDGLSINWLDVKSFNPKKIPGRLWATDFNYAVGGKLEEATDDKGSHYLGGIRKGNQFYYPIYIKYDGNYIIDYRTTGPRKSVLKTALIKDNGEEQVLENMTLPSTGGWHHWKTWEGRTVELKKGNYNLKVEAIQDGLSLNWLNIRMAEPHILPGKFKFSSYSKGTGGEIQLNSDKDEGEQLGNIRAKNTFIYDVKIKKEGNYEMIARITSQAKGKIAVYFSEDESSFYECGTFDLFSTLGWKNWDTIRIAKIQLTRKVKKIKIEVLQDGFMLNWLEFIKK